MECLIFIILLSLVANCIQKNISDKKTEEIGYKYADVKCLCRTKDGAEWYGINGKIEGNNYIIKKLDGREEIIPLKDIAFIEK